MAKPYRIREIEQETGELADTLIPRLLKELRTVEAVAERLQTSRETIFRWLQANGYERRVKVTWVKGKKNELASNCTTDQRTA